MNINTLPSLPFLGAYAPGVGSDMRSPRGSGINGGLSLRSPRAMGDCLRRVAPAAVNAYRKRHGLSAVPHGGWRSACF